MLLTKALRDCRNQLGNDREAMKQFPDVSFGSTSVKITIRLDDRGPDTPLSDVDCAFATQSDACLA